MKLTRESIRISETGRFTAHFYLCRPRVRVPIMDGEFPPEAAREFQKAVSRRKSPTGTVNVTYHPRLPSNNGHSPMRFAAESVTEEFKYHEILLPESDRDPLVWIWDRREGRVLTTLSGTEASKLGITPNMRFNLDSGRPAGSYRNGPNSTRNAAVSAASSLTGPVPASQTNSAGRTASPTSEVSE